MIVQLRMKLKVGRQRPQHFHYIREFKDDEDIGKILSQVASGDGWRVSGPETVKPPPPPSRRPCSCGCGRDFAKKDFASRQWSRPSRVARACSARQEDLRRGKALARRVRVRQSFVPPLPRPRPQPRPTRIAKPRRRAEPSPFKGIFAKKRAPEPPEQPKLPAKTAPTPPVKPAPKPPVWPAVTHGGDGYYDFEVLNACMQEPDAWMALNFLPCFDEDDGSITRSALERFKVLHPEGAALAERMYRRQGAIKEGC